MADVDPEVRKLIDSVENPVRRRDAETLLELMTRATGQPARIAYSGLFGFGTYHYQYESGRQGDAPVAGFAPRKPATTICLNDGVAAHADVLEHLGPHTTGVGCLYVKDLEQVDLDALERVVRSSYEALTRPVVE
jgi:hypothetical protein